MGRSERKKLTKKKSDSTGLHESKDINFSEEVEKAKRDGNLAKAFSLFGYLDPLKKKKVSKRKKTPSEQEFLSHVETILKIFLTYQRNHHSNSWAKLIYEYMCTSTADNSFENFLSTPQIQHMEAVLQDYITISMPIDEDNLLLQSLVDMASGLLKYLKEHRIDPYSCLVGLVAARDVIENTKSDKEVGLVAAMDGSDKKGSRADILQQIMAWAVIDDAEQLQREVREYAGQLRGVKKLNPGSLVLTEISKEKFIYARYPGGSCEGKTVCVYTDPLEIKQMKLKLDSIYPLKPSIVKRIEERTPLEMEKLVQLPTDALYQSIMRLVESETHGYFEEMIKIDMDVIRKANMNQCSISELQKLTEAQQSLRKLAKEPPTDLFSSLDMILKEKIAEFLHSGGNQNTFKPTEKENLEQLYEFQVTIFVMMHIQRYIGICESGLDQLKLQKRELMSGERKDKISEWWLHEIDNEVLSFLEGRGYVYDAVPENYVEYPPEDMNLVKENVRILSPLLNPEDNSTGIKEVIQRLQDRIYPKIEAFITDAKIVLSEQFNMDLTGKDFSLPQVEAAFEKEKESIDPQIREWIDDMIKDIHYLNEMHKLEDPEYAKNNEVSQHIVPISGLVVGMLCRLENECKTVCELWEIIDYEECSEDRTGLHEAIQQGDVDLIFDILSNNPEYINEQDANGFTPVHILASTHTTKHLEILERVLALENMNVNAKTVQGNTPLYYLVRHPVDTKENELLLRVTRKFTQKGSNVNAKNNAGETCLHSACVLDNGELVKLLIACGASVSEPNFEGETCLYTAVRAGNINVVKALIDFGVNLKITANGKTPLDIARQLKDEPLVRLLSGENVEVTQKMERKKYQKSSWVKDSSFWDDEQNRVSMQFCMDDLEELKAKSEQSEKNSEQTPGQTSAQTSAQNPVQNSRQNSTPRRQTEVQSQVAPIASLTKSSTETNFGLRRNSAPKHWTPTDRKLSTEKKRTQISLGSNRDTR